ncbi:hypothetical protein T08_856 [Trichinella sp. T8]|nr:hypothetical protein T08_856 [Trichinella sp. T8]
MSNSKTVNFVDFLKNYHCGIFKIYILKCGPSCTSMNSNKYHALTP